MVTESTSPAVSVLCTCRLLFSSRLHGTTRWSSGLGAAFFFKVVFYGSSVFASVRAFLERIIMWSMMKTVDSERVRIPAGQ